MCVRSKQTQLQRHQVIKQLPRGDDERQEVLLCCSPWGHKELDMTE